MGCTRASRSCASITHAGSGATGGGGGGGAADAVVDATAAVFPRRSPLATDAQDGPEGVVVGVVVGGDFGGDFGAETATPTEETLP